MKKIISLIFVCLLSAPAVVWLTGLEPELGMERIGLSPPRLYRQALFDNDYYLSFDQYFNDSFSLRDPLLYSKRWLDYRLFRMTDIADVHIGTKGWLYSRKSIEDHRREACNNRTEVGWLALELHALEKIIHAAGRRFLFFVVPNKATIYPEFVGYVPQNTSCNRSRLDLLLEFVAAHPMKSFVRLDDQLSEEKYNYTLLYDKNSTYWNDPGAMIAAEAIQRTLFEGTWQDRRLDYRSTDGAGHGDLSKRLMGFHMGSEDPQVAQITLSGQTGLPSGIVYSEDFMRTLLPYALQMFSRLKVIATDRVPSRQHGEKLSAYDVILLQKFESALDRLHIELDKIYSIFEDVARIPAKHSIDLNTVVPVSHIDMKSGSEGLEIKSVGTDSTLGFISIPASEDNAFRVLKLSIQSPHSDLMTVNYMTGLPYTASKPLKPGLNKVYLPLSFQNSLSLHIHPGKKAGLLLLRSAEILEFSADPGSEEPFQEKTSELVAAGKADESAATLRVKSETIQNNLASEPGTSVAEADIKFKDGDTQQVVSGDVKGLTPKKSPMIVSTSKKADSISAAESSAPHFQTNTNHSDSTVKPKLKVPGADFEIIAAGDFKVTNAVKLPDEATDPYDQYSLTPESSKEPAAVSKDTTHGSIAKTADPDEKNDVVTIAAERVTMPVPKAPSIVLTDFEDGRIFQRRGRSADIVVSGIYTGKLDALEARVVRDGRSEEVVPWTMIDAAPRNGIFVGTLMQVPQGGWYRLQVRDTGNHAVAANNKHKWGIGILVASLGQSNMKEWFYTGTALAAHSLLQKFSAKGWSEIGNKGNAAIAFGNRIIERLGIPVGILDFSKNGSGLRKEADWGTGYWEDIAEGSIYNRFLAGVADAGGTVEFVIWIQGEADAARGTVTENEYRSSLETFITNQVRADVDNGSDQQYLPFLIVMMVKRPGGRDEPHQAIRHAQKHVAENVADCYLAATTLDLKNQGRQHLTPDAYTTLGRRVAQTVLYILGEDTYHRGPSVSGTEQIDDRTIDIKIAHRGGTDITPATGMTGWEVVANGAPLTLAKVYRHDSQTIRIILENPLPGNASVRYLYGAMPDAARPVLDNSALSLPLEEYQSVLQ